jgi:hypothetical protein
VLDRLLLGGLVIGFGFLLIWLMIENAIDSVAVVVGRWCARRLA